MAEFKITRFRYTWKGTWDSSVETYFKDDVVLYAGSSWVCIRQHEPNLFEQEQVYIPPGNTSPSPAWIKMADGRKFIGSWNSATLYEPGNLVLAGGNLHICIESHTSSSNFDSDILKWEVFATGSNWREAWSPSARYRVGDVVRYNGYNYQCILEHSAGTNSEGIIAGNNDLNDDSTSETWKVSLENYFYAGEYSSTTRYRLNDLVKYGGSILRCIEEHTSSSTPGSINNDNWTNYLLGFNYTTQWVNGNYYAVGDVVKHGGIIYIAVANNNNIEPGKTSSNPDAELSTWKIIQRATDFKGPYQTNQIYLGGDLVRRGGSLWLSVENQIASDDSSLEFLDDTDWELVIPSYNYRGSWQDDISYSLYDVVYYRGSTYYANTIHVSSFENFPGDNGSGFNYWSLLIQGQADAALTYVGDLLTFNLNRTVVGDSSTIGTTTVPIGESDQLLIVEDNIGSIGYKTWGNFQRIFHVRKDGVDDDTDPNRGVNYFKPFKTVRFALEKANDGYEGHTTVKVYTGEYYEILPLIVPKKTAVIGEELRSVTIRANTPISALETDAGYTIAALVKFGLIAPLIIRGIPVEPLQTEVQQTFSTPATPVEVSIVDGLIANIVSMIDYRVNGNGMEPTVTGSNTETDNDNRLKTIDILSLNRSFIQEELITFIRLDFPEYSFDEDLCKRDISKFIDAILYDLRRPGNYKSVLAGRYYANAVTGSALEDMFYVRDATGIRNVTLAGLEGALPDLQAGESYRIPTGGNFVSLDPGWGPDDESVWITTRSCYIQNVTTFGAGAVGQKIDGLLHNGGNKSIVSNDFTQVISDGIGAWVQNGGRAELVSVFTYYAHIGMFAKDGGIIRATNGNSSYGDFGCIADGIDPDEVVRFGYINTRTEDAQVAAAFAGEINDFILALEFDNFGQGYTTASYTIRSSGTGAVATQEEFRDNALFNCALLAPGSGFTQYGNQAQSGTPLTITLASAETVQEEDILGMRIIIISGEGTGQYGYVKTYNSTSKVCTVYRESDDTPGWDNILPGVPATLLLTTGSRYRIEPRPTFNTPPYSANEVTLDISNAWAAAVYGETSETFVDVSGSAGSGTTNDVVPFSATFTVVKTARKYTLTMSNGGAGYAPGDVITIDGVDIGGLSLEHDIQITVLTTSEDSTNSILTFEYNQNAVADSGKFVLTPSTGHFGRYSADGDSWTAFDLPVDGNWKCLAAGNNKFVAISSGTNIAASSTNAKTWTQRTMPASRNWNSVAYGKSTTGTGVFLAIASNLNSAAYSLNGDTWVSATLPTFGDSTLNEWVDVAYGQGRFVIIANSGNIVGNGIYNSDTNTWSWDAHIMDVIADSTQKDWVSVAYGNRRWVALSSTGEVGYSFDGEVWYPATMPTQDGSTAHNWKQIRYGQGVFFAVGDTGSKVVGQDPTTGPSTFAATSYDGIVWENRELASSLEWGVVAFGNPDITLGDSSSSNSRPTWVVAPSSNSVLINKVYTGARALGRVVVGGQGVSKIKLWEPGSGYISDPVLSIEDPSSFIEPTFRMRTADGVLAQPTFTSKGSAYKTSTTFITVSGDGFADITPDGKFITLDGLTILPGPGAQFYIAGREDYFTAVVTGINVQTLPNGTIRSTFQISPIAKLADYFENGMEVLIRERYSQVRITGHDFLDVGTGNFEETNYPQLYKDYNFTPEPFQEVQNLNGGRVFYTSTDQNGNFRAGELFAVEQATGVLTISADFFDLGGLNELRLGGITVGSTAVVREFSKDPLFQQNSNSIIPTQRAIIAYLQSRLNVGGEDLLTPSFIAGTVKVGPNLIDSSAELTVEIPVMADFSGAEAHVSGSMLAQSMFFRSFRDN